MKILKQYQYQFCLSLYLCIIYHFPTFEILVLLLLTNSVNGFHDCLSNLNIILNILRKSKSNREFVYEEYVIVIFAKVIILSKTLSYNVSLKHTKPLANIILSRYVNLPTCINTFLVILNTGRT